MLGGGQVQARRAGLDGEKEAWLLTVGLLIARDHLVVL
jgi:hypothetical protein